MSFNFQRQRRIIKQVELQDEAIKIGAPAPKESSPEPDAQQSSEAQQRELDIQVRIQEAEKAAEKIMQEARAESSRLIQEAQVRMKEIEQQAYQQGFQQGEAAGKQELQQALNQFQTVVQAGLQAREEIMAQSEREIVRLVLEIVRRILRIEPLINEQALIRVTQHALERLGQKVEVFIYVHPEDVELLHFSLSQLENLALEIVIEPDDSMIPGGCRIRSRAGEIDASLEHQFKVIAQSFLALSEGEHAPNDGGEL